MKLILMHVKIATLSLSLHLRPSAISRITRTSYYQARGVRRNGGTGSLAACKIHAAFWVRQAKVKLVADAIWSKLSGAFSKDILHGQVN